ncbi:MAG: hypothetical protein HGA45_27185, partial [Chloroflexales bacterium]|nr:hypothetical protein [Chloroflexales bacterium]
MGLMNTAISLPPPVAEIIAAAFPGAAVTGLTPTVGGFSNLTVAASIGGARCIVKAAELPTKREDLRREHCMLGMLRGRRLGAPVPLAFAERHGWAVLVTRRRPCVETRARRSGRRRWRRPGRVRSKDADRCCPMACGRRAGG